MTFLVLPKSLAPFRSPFSDIIGAGAIHYLRKGQYNWKVHGLEEPSASLLRQMAHSCIESKSTAVSASSMHHHTQLLQCCCSMINDYCEM